MNADADYRWIELNPDYRSRLQRFECAEQQNRHSMDLFARHGFDDYGPDPDATQYHRWLKIPDKDLSVANESHGDI